MLGEAGDVGLEKHPWKSGKLSQYGTAGFRTKCTDLDHVMYRMGLLSALRSRVKKGATIGMMITASHNPEEDNGIKVVDPMGEMLEVTWESHATELANTKDANIEAYLSAFVEKYSIDPQSPASVFVARDTRPSSAALSQAAIDGIEVLRAKYRDYGILTTPQLHYMVRCKNTEGGYGEATERGYYDKLSRAYNELLGQSFENPRNYVPSLTIDGANGVGGAKWKSIASFLKGPLRATLVNDGTTGKLNHQCGADFVKVNQRAPEGMVTPDSGVVRCASFDGDADRIVYYYSDRDGKFQLLDGDRIATLVAGYCKHLLSASGLDLTLGLVQTAYANGNSTKYITEELDVPVACMATGVKHLHHRAQQFDVGVYFEANGHGTVLFSEKAMAQTAKASNDASLSGDQRTAATTLINVIDLINQTVGDAISDLLLVETVLQSYDWDVLDWVKCYSDLPNRQLKVQVKDRSVIETTDAERRTTRPPGLQEAIDKLVTSCGSSARAFVRPSGTEDVVRVYAEADTQQLADQLASDVGRVVYDTAGGRGRPPTL